MQGIRHQSWGNRVCIDNLDCTHHSQRRSSTDHIEAPSPALVSVSGSVRATYFSWRHGLTLGSHRRANWHGKSPTGPSGIGRAHTRSESKRHWPGKILILDLGQCKITSLRRKSEMVKFQGDFWDRKGGVTTPMHGIQKKK